MVDVRPFRGYRYDFEGLAKPPEKLLAPPYDVIPDDLLKSLSSEPLNICNVMLGNHADAYKRAAETFRGWVSSGKLIQDEEPCFYAYEQTFKIEGRTLQRTGLVALVKLEPLGKSILPHEKTHPKVKQDRLELLSAIKANIEQIFLICDDRESLVDEVMERVKQPVNEVLMFTDPDSVRHRLFRIPRESDIAAVTKLLAGKKALIADGHHRYETALKYSQQMDKENGPGAHDYVLATIVNSRNPGLMMLPTHRLIHSVDEGLINSLQGKLTGKFEIEPVADKATLMGNIEGREGCGVMGFWFPGRRSGFVATLKPEFCAQDPVERLDVAILHRYVLEEALGITPEMQERKEKVEFVKGTEEPFKEAERSGCQLLCLLTPASIPEVMEAAETGRKLPYKATYFYPKLWSGLIVYVF
jgi:uncharacterized protein (DUF1015 family)